MAYRILRAAKKPILALPMRLVSLKCWTAACVRWRIHRKCCSQAVRRMPPAPCVTCVMEGARPVLAEVQALVAPPTPTIPAAPATVWTPTGLPCSWQFWKSGVG